MGNYFYEKSKMYYEKYKAGKLVKKVDSIIKDGNKYLTIIREGKRAMFAGGSVDDGESTRQVIRCTVKELEVLKLWEQTLNLVKKIEQENISI